MSDTGMKSSDYEFCSVCGEETHVDEAACLGCGKTKQWAVKDASSEEQADRKPLTKTQREIILWLAQHDTATFVGQRGRQGMGRRMTAHVSATFGGLVIEDYQAPQIFLKSRGLIEEVKRNAPGIWYRLTESGRIRAEKLLAQAQPKAPAALAPAGGER